MMKLINDRVIRTGPKLLKLMLSVLKTNQLANKFFLKFGLIRQGAFGVSFLFSFQFFTRLAAVFAEEVGYFGFLELDGPL